MKPKIRISSLSLQIPDELHKQLRIIAGDENISMRDLVIEAIEDMLLNKYGIIKQSVNLYQSKNNLNFNNLFKEESE